MPRAILLSWVAVVALTGCGNVSHGVAKDGSTAQQLVWPAASDVTPMHRGGTFPAEDALHALHAGMNKQQIAQLIGYPHFDEGVWAVREWNYVFNFRNKDTDQVTVCQFKILFDQARLARRFYWKPEDCARYMSEPKAPAATRPAPEEVSLSADALFKFGRSSMTDITDGGRARLDGLATSLLAERDQIQRIHVIGYTDRLGGEAYNQKLSERRAETIKAYLEGRGVPADVIDSEGRGEADAVKQCPPMARAALIACLAPNRRVVVRVDRRSA